MTARETMRHKLTRLGKQSRQRGQAGLSVSAVSLWAETAICFLLAAVLAGVALPEDCAPFGVAMTAAAGSGRPRCSTMPPSSPGALHHT